jgi:hypothetical protein
MRLRLLPAVVLALAAVAQLHAIPEAAACGGCFPPPTQTTVVNAHRMALSVSSVQTVLWDQIQYSGEPTEFAWVLPIKPGGYIQVSSDAWFETLDAATTVRVVAPSFSCGGGSSGFGCGASADGLAAADEAGGGGVTVLHRGTVGPYDTVTVTTDTPGALNTWLEDNGFAVDPETQPVIDAYVAEDFDFIALKLSPGSDVKEMKPVRVITPGASPTLPLRMVAAGTGANVAITLFTIAEARLAPGNFESVEVPLDLVSWNFITQESNYPALRQQTLAAVGGNAFLSPYAQKGALLSPTTSPNAPFGVTYTTSGSVSPVDTIAAAYVQQGLANGETTDASCAEEFAGLAGSTLRVDNPCPPGVPFNDPSCDVGVPADRIDARVFACGPLDDLAIAFIGLHPRDVWLTRMEGDLPRAALATDLEIIPAVKQELADNYIRARVGVNAEESCDSLAPPLIDWERPGPARRMLPVWLTAIALAFALARRVLRPMQQAAR